VTAISTAPSSQNHLMILMCGIAAVGIQALMLSPLLPDIAQALKAGPVEIGIASGAYGAGVALSALVAAPRLGQWPKRQAIQIAFAVIAAGLALCAAAFDWRVIFGWSVAMVAGIPFAALIADLVDWRGTFLAVALISAGMIFGIGLLPRAASTAASRPVPYAQALAVKGIPLALIATFVFMIGFYQTYTFLGDHVRHLHHAGAWLGGLVACSYGLGFGLAVFFDGFIDRVGPTRLMAPALFILGINYILLPISTVSLWTAIAYPVFWGVAQHVGMNTLVSYIGAAPRAERSTAMGLFSFITYVAVGLGGGVYGSVYATYGFFATSLAATLSLWIGALLVLMFLPRSARACTHKFAMSASLLKADSEADIS